MKWIKWFPDNKIIANPDKVKSIINKKQQQKNLTRTVFKTEIASSVKLLGIHVDALVRIKYFLGYEERLC